MNRTLWKLDKIGERLWSMASMTAMQAALLRNEGRGLAVVADETRIMAKKVNEVVEKAMLEGKDIDEKNLTDFAFILNLLALNNAIESHRLGWQGKQAAICADEIRNLAYEIVCLFDEENAQKKRKITTPWASDPLSTVNHSTSFLLLNVGGIQLAENLDYVKEICIPVLERKDGKVTLRGMEISLVDAFTMLGETQKPPTYAIIQTPWAEQNKTYAIAAEVSCLFYSPFGKPINPPPDMPLAKYVRECWENENGEPIYFMDWTKMTE